MAIITEHLQLNKQFLIIDSPVPFTLIANNGTDEVYRMAGAWQIDTHKLLPEKYQKQYPVFNLDLVYDDTNLGGQSVTVRESNIDIGDGISGVNGQDVKVTNFNELGLDLSTLAQENTLQSILSYLPELKKKIVEFRNILVSDFIQFLQDNVPLSTVNDSIRNLDFDYYAVKVLYAYGKENQFDKDSGMNPNFVDRMVFNNLHLSTSCSIQNQGTIIGFLIENNKLYFCNLEINSARGISNYEFTGLDTKIIVGIEY